MQYAKLMLVSNAFFVYKPFIGRVVNNVYSLEFISIIKTQQNKNEKYNSYRKKESIVRTYL